LKHQKYKYVILRNPMHIAHLFYILLFSISCGRTILHPTYSNINSSISYNYTLFDHIMLMYLGSKLSTASRRVLRLQTSSSKIKSSSFAPISHSAALSQVLSPLDHILSFAIVGLSLLFASVLSCRRGKWIVFLFCMNVYRRMYIT